MIDAIDDKSLEYSKNGGVAVGGFTWSLHFTWREVPAHEKLRRQKPYNPTRYAGDVKAVEAFRFVYNIMYVCVCLTPLTLALVSNVCSFAVNRCGPFARFLTLH